MGYKNKEITAIDGNVILIAEHLPYVLGASLTINTNLVKEEINTANIEVRIKILGRRTKYKWASSDRY